MPTFRHGKLTDVVLSNIIASPYLKSADSARSMETVDTSGFGSAAKSYIPGQQDATFSLGGMFDGTVGAIDETLSGLSAAEEDYPATLFYDGGVIPGRMCRFGAVKQTTYSVSSPVGDVVSLSVELQCSGGVKTGLTLTDKTQRNASINFATVDWGAGSATTGGGVVNLHIPYNTRNTATSVKLQHSTDGTVWVDLLTQSVSAATTAGYVLAVTGTVNRYTRVITTLTAGTGLITTIAAFARN